MFRILLILSLFYFSSLPNKAHADAETHKLSCFGANGDIDQEKIKRLCHYVFEGYDADLDKIDDFDNVLIFVNDDFREEDLINLLPIISNYEITLEIENMCVGACSRVLIAAVDKVIFNQDSFAVLTDSSFINPVDFIGGGLLKDGALSGKIFNKPKIEVYGKSYKKQFDNLIREGQLLVSKTKSASHLQIYDIEKTRIQKIISRNCKPIGHYGLVLTPEYLNYNNIVYNADWSLPRKEIITEKFSKKFGQSTLQYAFDTGLFFDHRYDYQAYKRCHPYL